MTRALLLNAGSSTLKWSTADLSADDVDARGTVEWSPTDAAAGAEVLNGLAKQVAPVDYVVHRVVHGGARFRRTVRIDDKVRKAIAELSAIDPWHAPLAVAGIDAVARVLPDAAQVAAFDTAFHATIPEHAARYALPRTLTEPLAVRRYGFHGLSVSWSLRRATAMLGARPARLIVCHLGSGCSATAVSNGKSVDTTMGFTPLEGIVMSTRSGTIDPGIVFALLRNGVTTEAVQRGLERDGGLRGLAGEHDFRALAAASDAGSADARLAIAVFAHSVVRHVGALAAVLGGIDALVFTGGIGEHEWRLRADVAAHLAFAGMRLDDAANRGVKGDTDVSAPDASVRTLVITAREDLAMLDELRGLVAG